MGGIGNWRTWPATLVLLTSCSGSQLSAPEPGQSPAPASADADLTILHLNDHHSHLHAQQFELDVSTLQPPLQSATGQTINSVRVSYGGFPLLVTTFAELTGDADNVLKLHAGDAIAGTAYYSLLQGEADAALMNRVCFDAFAVGNHEFDGGDRGLSRFLDALGSGDCYTAVLGANVVPGPDSAIASGYLQPYTVIHRGGADIGIVGINIADKTLQSSRPDPGTRLLDEFDTAQHYINELVRQGVDRIVLLTHVGYPLDLQLAATLRDVDVIVGGDSHTLLGDGSFDRFGFNARGDYPTRITNAQGHTVCVVQAWEYARALGQLHVNFDAEGVVTSCTGAVVVPFLEQFSHGSGAEQEHPLSAADRRRVTALLATALRPTGPDAGTAALLENFSQRIGNLGQHVIGRVEEDLCREYIPGQGRSVLCDSAASYRHGGAVANLVAHSFLAATPTADIALQNAGGVRGDIAAGEFTMADAFALLPFNNTLVTLSLTGAELVAVLEQGLGRALASSAGAGAYPYTAGLRFRVDASQPMGRRISEVQVNPRLAGAWTALVPTANYTLVTNDFVASGRDGYHRLGQLCASGACRDTRIEYAQAFIDYLADLAQRGLPLSQPPSAHYSTLSFTDAAGCNHSLTTDCQSH